MGYFKQLNPHQDVDFASSLAFCKVRESDADVENRARLAFLAANPELSDKTKSRKHR